jgi:serine/threonine protein kinase
MNRNRNRFGISLGKLVGHGKQGSVYEFLNGPKKYLIKINDKNSIVDIRKEVFIQKMAIDIGVAPKILSFTKDYIVMEYIDGLTVEELLEIGPLSKKIIDKIYDTIDKLHSIGIIHNDLMPSNIMITLDSNDNIIIKIIDYGSSEYNKNFTEDDYMNDIFYLI